MFDIQESIADIVKKELNKRRKLILKSNKNKTNNKKSYNMTDEK